MWLQWYHVYNCKITFFCSSWSAGGHLASRNTVSSERIMLYEWWQLVLMMLWSRKSDYECKLTVYLSKLVSHKIYAMPYFKRLSIKFQRFMAKLFQFFSLSIFFLFFCLHSRLLCRVKKNVSSPWTLPNLFISWWSSLN